jgi:uncharacterized membrane protein
MKIKYILALLGSVIALAMSEYLFLMEMSGKQRPYIIILTTAVAIASVTFIFLTYRFSREKE